MHFLSIKKGDFHLSFYQIIFLAIFLLSLTLKILSISDNNISFAYDQARDMLDIRSIVVGHNATLIGPTTSINGVFLGPFWYYFNIIPYMLGSGNPVYLVYWMIFCFQLTSIILFVQLYKKSPILALLASSFFLMSPPIFYASRVSWSAYPMPIFIVLFFLCLFSNLEKTSNIKAISLGLIIGLALQIEAAFGIILLPFALLLFFINKINVKYFILLIIGFFTTLLPQILFELKHNFLMTNVLINEFTGKTMILGEKLSLTETFINHLNSYINSTNNLFYIPNNLSAYVFAAAVFFLLIKILTKKINFLNKQYFLILSAFILFSFVCYLFYPQNLKNWYLLGLVFPYLMILAICFYEIFRSKKIIALGAILFIFLLFISSINNQKNEIAPKLSTDANNFKNQIAVIDWIYNHAQGEGFKVFSYFPSVYDFPYQYLFWWYGTNKYGYQPSSISYLRNVPEYIAHNESYLTKRKQSSENSKTYLIIQADKDQPKRQLDWINNFNDLCLEKINKFSWNTEIWIKVNCIKK